MMLYAPFLPSICTVEDLLFERGVDLSRETIRYRELRLGPMFTAKTRRQMIEGMKPSRWRWHLD